MKLEAYLFFPGNTEEAMTFYRDVFGGDLTITRARRRRSFGLGEREASGHQRST